MLKDQWVSEVSPQDLILNSRKNKARIFDSKPTKGGRIIRKYTSTVLVAGLDFALMFLEPTSSAQIPPYHFTVTGAQVLLIAKYFSKQKQERRRQKHERALKDFMNKKRSQ